jgi:hypothetical protein
MSSRHALALAITNAPWRQQIDETTLRAVLVGDGPLSPWALHVATFFGEAPVAAIERFLATHNVPLTKARAVCRQACALTGERCSAFEAWADELDQAAT